MKRNEKQPTVCGWCRTWMVPPRKGQPQGLMVSHGMCSACAREHFPDDVAELRRADRLLWVAVAFVVIGAIASIAVIVLG